MKVELLYSTPDYHKLVEMAARECYQSYHKLGGNSENFIKAIMAKGHISIASVGNIVFSVDASSLDEDECEVSRFLSDLVTMKEINNYIRWTTPDGKRNRESDRFIISMNLLTLLDIYNNIDNYVTMSELWKKMLELVKGVPELCWFIDKDVELEPKQNPYTSKGEPELYSPVILTQDYTALKEKGLTDYELDIHSTVTVNMKVDRATVLQMWRHADMTGGTELSQRYVDRSNAEYRRMIDFEQGKYPDFSKFLENNPGLTETDAKEDYDLVVRLLYEKMNQQIRFYSDIRDHLVKLGVRQGRAKEIARSILPNAITTKTIQCRPLRQWKHFFKLRDSVHAQKEIEQDTKALKVKFAEEGISYE